MKQGKWPVTFSIEIATFTTPPQSLDDVIVKADGLMYYVKHHGKNGLASEIY